jgi:hypothetical protein
VRGMTYDVQIFSLLTETHLTKEMNKRASAGWSVISTAAVAKNFFIVTWGRPV